MPLAACNATPTKIEVPLFYFFSDKLRGKTLSAMALNIKTFFLALLFIIILLSSGLVEGFKDSIHPAHHLIYKDGRTKSRKLFSHVYMLDYEEAGANQRHNKKPGKSL